MKALIIGGSQGFGKEVSDELKLKGYEVITVGRSDNSDFVCDIGDLEKWQKTAREIKEKYKDFNLIIFIAGYARAAASENLTINDWNEHLNKNLLYVALGIGILKESLSDADSKIVTIGSQWSYKIGIDELVPYTISKHALDAFTKDFAVRNPGIKANHYCVPPMYTVQAKQVWESFERIGKKYEPKIIVESKMIAISLVNNILINDGNGQTLSVGSDGIVEQVRNLNSCYLKESEILSREEL